MLEAAEALTDNLSIQVENNALDLHEQVIFFYFCDFLLFIWGILLRGESRVKGWVGSW